MAMQAAEKPWVRGCEKAINTDSKKKEKMKQYADKQNHGKNINIQIGNFVLVRQQQKNKPYRVTEVKGKIVTANSENNGNITRNASVFKRTPTPNLEPPDQIIQDFNGDLPNMELAHRYPTHNRRIPEFYKYFTDIY